MMEQPQLWQFQLVTLNFKHNMIKIQVLVFLMGLFLGFLIGVFI